MYIRGFDLRVPTWKGISIWKNRLRYTWLVFSVQYRVNTMMEILIWFNIFPDTNRFYQLGLKALSSLLKLKYYIFKSKCQKNINYFQIICQKIAQNGYFNRNLNLYNLIVTLIQYYSILRKEYSSERNERPNKHVSLAPPCPCYSEIEPLRAPVNSY